MLKFLQGFQEAIFLGVAMKCLLGDEDFRSVKLEYRIKSVITIDPTVGSRSNIYRGFYSLLSLG